MVALEDSSFSGAAPQLLDPTLDWEIDSPSLVIKEKIGTTCLLQHVDLYHDKVLTTHNAALQSQWCCRTFALKLHRKQQHSLHLPGEGEFGVVHKAVWNGTVVAAKVLKGSDAIALGDFRGELDVLRRVHHPNAVQFLGAQTNTQPFVLITELMYGKSLADAFKYTQVCVCVCGRVW